MKKWTLRLQYNAPVILSFALLSLGALLLNQLTMGRTNRLLFSVYRCSLADVLAGRAFFCTCWGMPISATISAT